MRFSFFCKHCGKHLRQGDHRECKKILRTEERKSREKLSESSQKFLAKTGER